MIKFENEDDIKQFEALTEGILINVHKKVVKPDMEKMLTCRNDQVLKNETDISNLKLYVGEIKIRKMYIPVTFIIIFIILASLCLEVFIK